MILGQGESGIARLENGVVIKTTHRTYLKEAMHNFALAIQTVPQGLAPKFISFENNELRYEFVKGDEVKDVDDTLLKLHAKQLAILHEKKYDLVGPLTHPKKGRFSLYKALLEEWRGYNKYSFANEYRDYYYKLKKVLKEKDNFFTKRQTSFTHSDCALVNMIQHKNKLTYIDWELSCYEDPAKDVAGCYRPFPMKPWCVQLTDEQEKLYLNTYKLLSNDKTILVRVKLFHLYHAFIDALYFEWKVRHYEQEKTHVLSKKGYQRALNNCKRYLETQLNSSPEKNQERKVRLIKLAKKTAKRIYAQIPCVSVYLKGSLVRDEVVYNSDIDLVVILKHEKDFQKLKLYEDTEITIARYTLKELRTGVASLGNKHTPPNATNYDFHNFWHLEGEKIDATNFPKTDIQKRYVYMPTLIRQVIDGYYNHKFGFGDIVKQVLWLARVELTLKKGLDFYRWADVVSHYPKNHLYQKAYYYRLHRPKKRGKRSENFIRRIEKYLDQL